MPAFNFLPLAAVPPFLAQQESCPPGILRCASVLKDAASIVEKIRAANGAALIVGHSNTVPDVLTRLGIANPPKLGDADYDNLFVVTGGDKPALIRLHYR